ncbi:FAD/NAD(P)-binding protein [Sorangium sp. So ce134]
MSTELQYRLAIVGAGPSCTYVLERLASHLSRGRRFRLAINVFDPTGEFGAGSVHSPSQPITSPLNRIAGQIGFGADETNVRARTLLAPAERPDFITWCRERHASTGDERFRLTPESWPKRFLHGHALRDMFDRYVRILRGVPGVSVNLVPREVIGLEIRDGAVRLRASGQGGAVVVDHVLLVTGHTKNRVLPGGQGDQLRAAAGRGGGFIYVDYPYPLDRALGAIEAGGDVVVGCRGMGLSAFDVVLYLTEGRGGAFVREHGAELVYRRSGHEPRLVLFCRSGIFTATRPYNAKEVDLAALEHRGVFFTRETVDRLRAARGRAIVVPGFGLQRQLDFEADVLPVMLLEMRYIHYRVLFGDAFAERFRQRGAGWLDRFVAGDAGATCGVEPTTDGTEEVVNDAMAAIAAALAGASAPELAERCAALPVSDVLAAYFTVVLGEERGAAVRAILERGGRPSDALADARSPWGHSLDPEAHRFDWAELVAPISLEGKADPDLYRRAVIDYLRHDIQQARQDNLRNPTKAACDGVWRDLRQTLGYVVDHGGLLAASHRVFLERYLPLHNRLANGASIEVMEQMLALLEAGVIDVGTGPGGDVRVGDDGLFVVGPLTGAERRVHALIEARVHTFDVRHVDSPLYRELLERGYVRPWVNPALDGEPYAPGGVDITDDHRPVSRDGRVVPELTFLGVPTEGRLFYQIGAARPRQDHHIINDVIQWLEGFLAGIPEACYPADPAERECAPAGRSDLVGGPAAAKAARSAQEDPFSERGAAVRDQARGALASGAGGR